MDYSFPNSGYTQVKNQFLIGDSLLVAPVLDKGCSVKKVLIPKGTWKGFDGKSYSGPKSYEVIVGISDLPFFEKIK